MALKDVCRRCGLLAVCISSNCAIHLCHKCGATILDNGHIVTVPPECPNRTGSRSWCRECGKALRGEIARAAKVPEKMLFLELEGEDEN